MAYYITDTPTTGRGRRLLVAIAAGLIVLVGLALLVWPAGGGTRAAAPEPAEPALSWALVGGAAGTDVAPGRAGPLRRRCRGRVHPPRTSSARCWPRSTSPPGSPSTSGRRSTRRSPASSAFGDIDTALAQLRTTRSPAPPAATVATGYFYRVDGGDPPPTGSW